jgi:hypothetical protein
MYSDCGGKMNLSDNQVSQAIAAVMGTCWHKFEYDEKDKAYCVKCKKPMNKESLAEYIFSAFTPDGIFAWKSYMEENLFDMWDSFVEENFKPALTDEFSWSWCLDNAFDPRRFVRYLYDNLDGWGREECMVMNCNPSYCPNSKSGCDQSGKVLTERARKFKAIVEGEG